MITILNVEVTAEDIKCGQRNSPSHCPIAKAIRRLIPGIICVDERIMIGYNQSATLPPEAHDFIVAFDTGESVEPFSFTTELVNDSYGD